MFSASKFITCCIICTIMLVIVPRVSSQVRLTVAGGLIDNLQEHPGHPRYAFYPEIQLSNDFFAIPNADVTVGAGLYWGYWSDGVDESSRCVDCWTFSHSSHIVGTRLLLALDALPLPVTTFVGFSRHFIKADFVDGANLLGNPGSDFDDAFNTAEVGVRLQIPISQNLHIGGNYQHYKALVVENNFYSLARASTSRSSFGIVLTRVF